MKNIFAFLSLSFIFNAVYASNDPVVGVWEKYSISKNGQDLIARTSYIVTNKKLSEKTIFSAFQNSNPLIVICCVEVKNIIPVELSSILAKYSMDSGFVKHMKSIKGLNFIYEAVPIEKAGWNKLMASIMATDSDSNDFSPYMAPVISAKLGEKDEAIGKLELGPTKAKLIINYQKDNCMVIYKFIINGNPIIFSEEAFPAE